MKIDWKKLQEVIKENSIIEKIRPIKISELEVKTTKSNKKVDELSKNDKI